MIFPYFLPRALVVATFLSFFPFGFAQESQPNDPCAEIGRKEWATPAEVRACYKSYPLDPIIKSNIIDVINKTLPFHVSQYYQIQAPPPFELDVHEDIAASVARISQQEYESEFDMHLDLQSSFFKLRDGHCVWINECYDGLWVNYVPAPLSLLAGENGTQGVYISQSAFNISKAMFGEDLQFWQNVLPGELEGHLDLLSGARVLLINGQDPFAVIDAYANATGGFQGFGTRQNTFFSSYHLAETGWSYLVGSFAAQGLPLVDEVTLTLQQEGYDQIVNVTLPYRSRFNPARKSFTDMASWRRLNCRATKNTNGVDLYADTQSNNSGSSLNNREAEELDSELPPIMRARGQDWVHLSPAARRRILRQPIDVLLSTVPRTHIPLSISQASPLTMMNASNSVALFYMMTDGETGVLALGSFQDSDYQEFGMRLLRGLKQLKAQGATKLVIDVTNNGGGFVCIASWLHRIIIGPKSSTVPQAGLDGKVRAHALARLIVERIAKDNADPDQNLIFNPVHQSNAENQIFAANATWLDPIVHTVVNEREDEFSPSTLTVRDRLGSDCLDSSPGTPPSELLFEGEKVVIVSNGVCASSCAIFSIVMNLEEGSKTLVVGGKVGVPQQYGGTVAGQASDFSTMDTNIKSVGLKDNPLAPPDLIVNGVLGIAFRLAYGIQDPEAPAEWQNHEPTMSIPLTPQLVNNPQAIWEEAARLLL